jgi:hypothetical protein
MTRSRYGKNRRLRIASGESLMEGTLHQAAGGLINPSEFDSKPTFDKGVIVVARLFN